MLDWTPLPPKHLKSQCILCTITLLWTRLFNCTSCRLGKPSFKEIQFKGRNKSTPTPIIVEVHSVKWNWVEATLQCRPPLPQDNYFLLRIQNLFCTHLRIPFRITIDGQSLCEGMEAIRRPADRSNSDPLIGICQHLIWQIILTPHQYVEQFML